jgi:hypothetical protein
VDKSFFTNVRGPQFEGDVIADFSDLRRLQILTDKLRKLVQILRLNIRIGRQLAKEMSRINIVSSPTSQTGFDRIQLKLELFLLGQETSVDRVETLIARSSGIGQLVSNTNTRTIYTVLTNHAQVQNIQDIRATEASKQINLEMQKLTEQGIKENKLMKRLTEQSTGDTRSMMAIALISAVFLPATFLAVRVPHH